MDTVITGIGIIGPKIRTISNFSQILNEGKIVLEKEEIKGINLYLGRVNEEDILLPIRSAKRYPKAVRMLLHACQEALNGAKADLTKYKVAVVVGSSGGVISDVLSTPKNPLKRKNPFLVGNMNGYTLSSSVSSAFHINGPSYTVANSCTSGSDAIHLAQMLLQTGQAEICIVAGTDSIIEEEIIHGFLSLGSLHNFREEHLPSGPFSNNGFSISEGSAAIILERKDVASKRKATPLAELKKVTMSNDAVSPYLSDPTGTYLLQAVDECLNGEMPSYINSQALGIIENDDIETSIYERRFKEHNIPITSIKGMVGHPMGASGLFQLLSSVLSINEGFIPPTKGINQIKSSKEIFTNTVLERPVDSVLITSHGYGGSNTCIYIKK